MPHTTTKNARTKRPDTRPNAIRRAKKNRDIEDKKTIQDIRVTKKLKKDRVEREAVISTLRDDPQVSEEKYLRALRKKLRDVDILIKRQENGEDLDEQQIIKIGTLDEVMAKMESAINKSAQAAAALIATSS